MSEENPHLNPPPTSQATLSLFLFKIGLSTFSYWLTRVVTPERDVALRGEERTELYSSFASLNSVVQVLLSCFPYSTSASSSTGVIVIVIPHPPPPPSRTRSHILVVLRISRTLRAAHQQTATSFAFEVVCVLVSFVCVYKLLLLQEEDWAPTHLLTRRSCVDGGGVAGGEDSIRIPSERTKDSVSVSLSLRFGRGRFWHTRFICTQHPFYSGLKKDIVNFK